MTEECSLSGLYDGESSGVDSQVARKILSSPIVAPKPPLGESVLLGAQSDNEKRVKMQRRLTNGSAL